MGPDSPRIRQGRFGHCIVVMLMMPLGVALSSPNTATAPKASAKHTWRRPALQLCKPAFDRALALLHNFWYARALTQFQEIQKADPECAMAYWGAAMTYNHPFWDDPSREDEAAAWAYVQKGLTAQVAERSRAHVPPGRRRALQGCRRGDEAVT